MAYISDFTGDFIVDDSNFNQVLDAKDENGNFLGKGYEPRDYDKYALGSYAKVLPPELYIPSYEWIDRIEELQAKNGFPIHHRKAHGIQSLDQKSTSSCWAQCVTQGAHYVRAMQGNPFIALSPASLAGPINRYRDRGGWPGKAFHYAKQYGFVTQSLWPANAIEKKYNTQEANENRAKNKFGEEGGYELPPNDYNALISVLLRGSPTPIGILSWRHAILAVDLKVRGSDPESDILIGIDNSWGKKYGNNGIGYLSRSKSNADEAIALTSMMAI